MKNLASGLNNKELDQIQLDIQINGDIRIIMMFWLSTRNLLEVGCQSTYQSCFPNICCQSALDSAARNLPQCMMLWFQRSMQDTNVLCFKSESCPQIDVERTNPKWSCYSLYNMQNKEDGRAFPHENYQGVFQLVSCEYIQIFSRDQFAKIPCKVSVSIKLFCSQIVRSISIKYHHGGCDLWKCKLRTSLTIFSLKGPLKIVMGCLISI